MASGKRCQEKASSLWKEHDSLTYVRKFAYENNNSKAGLYFFICIWISYIQNHQELIKINAEWYKTNIVFFYTTWALKVLSYSKPHSPTLFFFPLSQLCLSDPNLTSTLQWMLWWQPGVQYLPQGYSTWHARDRTMNLLLHLLSYSYPPQLFHTSITRETASKNTLSGRKQALHTQVRKSQKRCQRAGGYAEMRMSK